MQSNAQPSTNPVVQELANLMTLLRQFEYRLFELLQHVNKVIQPDAKAAPQVTMPIPDPVSAPVSAPAA